MRNVFPCEADQVFVSGVDFDIKSGRHGDNGVTWGLAYELGLCKICLEYRIRQHSMEVVQASFPFNLHSSILIRSGSKIYQQLGVII